MKRIIPLLVLCAVLASAIMAGAQEIETPDAPTWMVATARSIVWIGEDITIIVNGTPRTTALLEFRPVTENGTGQPTFYTHVFTNINGSAIIDIPARHTYEAGDYVVALLLNGTLVASTTLTVNYDPQRYNEIERQRIWDYLRGHVQEWINSSMAYDADHEREIAKLNRTVYILSIIIVIIIIVETPNWINRYAAYLKKSGKGSFQLRMMSRMDDRSLIYGGGTIGKDDPKLQPTHETTDFRDYAVDGLTSEEIVDKINDNARKIGAPLPVVPVENPTVRGRWFGKPKKPAENSTQKGDVK